ncbi:MAG: L-lactate dehydrogenase [Deltaproteobacteria bacterium]|nr:MAG: L-lactate dehydrogenase [Deltaproteobacteria bacterium]
MTKPKIVAYEGACQNSEFRSGKVSIIGTGQVGMAIAYAMVIENSADHLVLVDSVPQKAEGEAMDLLHGLSFVSPMTLEAGGYEDCAGSHLVIITAGAKRKPGETRLDLMQRNADIFRDMIPKLVSCCPDAVFLIVSNPVDVMTYVASHLSGLPKGRVIGTGTLLDTARFRALLSERLDIDPRNVHAYILGEHGDSEVAVWSKVNIAGVPLQSLLGAEELGVSWEDIAVQVRDVAKEVIQRKGATCYAIGLGTARLAQAVLRDQKRVMTAACVHEDVLGVKDVALSLPVIIGAQGVERVIQLELEPSEEDALRSSARTLRDALDRLGEI